ncbi:MAG TPA: bifunctional pyr operon transcriptional regulator/uracil phosphoribosyltransferase PyrR [Haloplasmataceae bacterium]
MSELRQIIDANTLTRMLRRISHEILERNQGTDDLVIIGIMNKGTKVAKKIQENILQIEGVNLPLGELDITSFRDDTAKKEVNNSKIDFSVENKKVILVDDVIYTGRSVRAALDAIIRYGRPKEIQLASVIDRGHRELPIRSDYVGKNIPTSRKELVLVKLENDDKDNGVYIKRID